MKGSVRREELLRYLPEKGIFYNPHSTFQGVKAEPVRVERRGALIHFRVDIGVFTLLVMVLNLNSKAPEVCRSELHRRSMISVQERMSMLANSYVSKRIRFTDTTKALK